MVEIIFDDEVLALILLASLLNNWESIKIIVSNSVDSTKLNFNDVKDWIFTEDVRRKDTEETSTLGFALNP